MPDQDLVGKRVDNFIVPIGTISLRSYKSEDGSEDVESVYESFGTAFFVGNSGHLLTAAHVVEQMEMAGGDQVFIIPIGTAWHSYRIEQSEKHPSEDVAILKALSRDWHSIAELSPSSEHATCEYMLWGYPEHVSLEASSFSQPTPSGSAIEKPELIVSMGYIRRRISRELPYGFFKGRNFYEISDVAGSKCSGSPVIRRERTNFAAWSVIGIYIGESTGSWQFAVGYAVRTDALVDWSPLLLGHSIFDEKASAR